MAPAALLNYSLKQMTSSHMSWFYFTQHRLFLTEATLSFLVVGVPITQPSLGLLVKTGFDVLFSGLWWASVFPGLYIMLIVFGINLLGDFLRDELNPNLK